MRGEAVPSPFISEASLSIADIHFRPRRRAGSDDFKLIGKEEKACKGRDPDDNKKWLAPVAGHRMRTNS